MSSPFFIVGVQRSGTTLLRLILNSHPELAIPEEGTFLMPLLKAKYVDYSFKGIRLIRLIDYIRQHPQLELWNKDFAKMFRQLEYRGEITLREFLNNLYGYYAQSEGKLYWGDKTPSFFRKINVLRALFPDAKFIHIVRDPRDVYDSWRKIDRSKNNAPVVALDWIYKVWKCEKKFEDNVSKLVLTIRYEDLLDAPESVIIRVCKHIGVEFRSEMLKYYETSKHYIGKHHSKLIHGPVDKRNKYKWKRVLTNNERNSITFITKTFLLKYDYELEPNYYSVQTLAYVAVKLLYGLPLRILQVLRTKFLQENALRKGKKLRNIRVGDKPE